MDMDVRETGLESGLRVITAHMPQVESVALGVWVGVGGRHESRRICGISHFIEHLLFKGTRTRSAREISQAIEGRGGYFNAFTQEEGTCYYARIGRRHLWEVLEILADMYLHPRFAAEDIEKERGVIIEEIMMYWDQPQHVVQEKLGELLWPRHALGRPLVGTPENIRRLRRRDFLAFKRANYVPNNTVVAIAGRVDHDACVRRVDALLRSARPGRPIPFARVGRRLPKPLYVLHKKVEQTHLALGIRLFGRHDPRRYALKLLSVILGENMSSRLFQVVREQHGLAYSIHSGVHLYQETGALLVHAGLDRKRTPKALTLILRQIAQLKNRRVGASELRRAKDYAIGQLEIALESTTNQMMWLGEHWLGYGRIVQPSEVVRRLESVTASDVLRVANEALSSHRLSIALLVPEGTKLDEDWIREQGAKI